MRRATSLGGHAGEGCPRALRAWIGLYRRLRDAMDDGGLARRAEAGTAGPGYLDEIDAAVLDRPFT